MPARPKWTKKKCTTNVAQHKSNKNKKCKPNIEENSKRNKKSTNEKKQKINKNQQKKESTTKAKNTPHHTARQWNNSNSKETERNGKANIKEQIK